MICRMIVSADMSLGHHPSTTMAVWLLVGGETVRKLRWPVSQKQNSHFWGFSKSNQCRPVKSSFIKCTPLLASVYLDLTNIVYLPRSTSIIRRINFSDAMAWLRVAIAVNLFNLNIHNSNSSPSRLHNPLPYERYFGRKLDR